MAKIVFSDNFKLDLEQICAYISTELKSPMAALNTVRKIRKTISNLENFPYSGASLSFLVDIDTDYRYLVNGSYMTFYRVLADDIYVDRILYGKQNYISVLFPGSSDCET